MELCLGTVQFGMNYGVQRAGQPKLSDALDIIDIAIHNGVNSIDTSAAYGTAEEVIGEFLKKHNGARQKVELISKLSPNALDSVPQERYTVVVREHILQSLQKLGTDYLDGYLLHNSAQVFDEAIVDAMYRIKKEGLIRCAGSSVYLPKEAQKGIEHGLDILQIPYSVLDQRMDEQGIFECSHNKGIKFYSRSAFTQGLILMECQNIPKHLERAKTVVKKLSAFCASQGVSRLQLAVSFVCRQKSISHLVFGVDKKEQLMEIINAHQQSVAVDILEEVAQQFAGLDEDIILPNRWTQ